MNASFVTGVRVATLMGPASSGLMRMCSIARWTSSTWTHDNI
jgi:hypothetical protein